MHLPESFREPRALGTGRLRAQLATTTKERTIDASPKSSENDPPPANQAVGEGDDQEQPEASATTGQLPAAETAPPTAPQIVPGKPDGEVDTRP